MVHIELHNLNGGIMPAKTQETKDIHNMYRPIIDLVYKLYCVPSQSDNTMRTIMKELDKIGHVDTINL